MLVFLTALLLWFIAGFAIAFGVKPDAVYLQVAGFSNGWVGDFSGGHKYEQTDNDHYYSIVVYY